MEITAQDLRKSVNGLYEYMNKCSKCRKKSLGVLNNYKAKYLVRIVDDVREFANETEQAKGQRIDTYLKMVDEELRMLNLFEGLQ